MKKSIIAVLALSICGLIGCSNHSHPKPTNDPTPTVSEGTISVTGVSLDTETLYLAVGSSSYLKATVKPNNATDTSLSWKSSKDEVATVNSDGKVTAIKEGTSTITVTTNDGGYKATCLVTVSEDEIPVTGVSINYDAIEVEVNKTLSMKATIEPYNATNTNVTWIVDDEEVASVSTLGVVTGKKEGETTVTVTTEDGNYQASCDVTVIASTSGDNYQPDSSDTTIMIITEGGEYTLGQDYKQVYVNAPGGEVTINLNGKTIENSENSPIYVASCSSIDISAGKNTTNYVKDMRNIYSEDDNSQGKGAIYVADGDLKLKGTGTLNITANYLNGVHGKDDVKVQKMTLNISAVNHGIRGNDSVEIISGTVNISCGGDGLHTSNTDVSSKGNQRGNITLSGGTITINSWGDAIAAAYDAYIEEADSETPLTLNIATNKYSSYDGETVETSSSSFYLKMNSSTYSNGNYTYAAYINNAWYKASYKGTQTTESQGGGGFGPGGGGGRSSTYYIYEIEKPSSATSFKLYRFSGSNVTSFSTSSYNAVSDNKAFNSAYDMVQISVSGSTINFSNWSNYGSNGTSSKGIKAENEAYISGGDITINAYDDAIHVNSDASLENGNSPLGNVNISGGTLNLSSSDDAIHADYTVNISGGTVNVTSSYEGIEANLIRINGGSTYVVATDDGMNATSGKTTPNITVSGGLLDVMVPSSSDTDGIDSNGTYTQTGGVVIVKGPGSASGNTMGAAALDTDSTVKISSGTLVVFGGIEQTPSYSGTTKTLCSSSTVSTGSKTISFSSMSYTTTLKYSTNGCIVYSSLGSATLK